MPNPTAFPEALLLPDDPTVRLSPQQLKALFPDAEANQRFASSLYELHNSSHSALGTGAKREKAR